MRAVDIEFLKDVAKVVLGWLLGVGSTALKDWKDKRRRRRRMRAAVARELDEIAYRLLALIYTLEGRHGTFNRQLLE
jgi:hypothetical protein